ncbi:MAG: immunity 53 family protein [Bacteroidetes bacterium]|nr:immunity 53 family protein [Bacteroidota bacterium]
MNNDNLNWLSEWYQKKCDGDWEHYYGIKIETIDNPGWSVIIDLQNSVAQNLISIPWVFIERNEKDWYGYKIDKGRFEASGDSFKLDFLINLFREIVDGSVSSVSK